MLVTPTTIVETESTRMSAQSSPIMPSISSKQKGYKVAFAECTGAGSTKIFREKIKPFGYSAECYKFVDYSTWAGTGKEVVNKIHERGENHTGMSLMVVKL